ncbi:MAG: sensor histidine kinase [Candidatus Eremiobacteraeota bacterium]|nr:sensor histidine kinase [Candidatus Eremiobacteraeota bacterium]MBV9408129.1 sensor histidine kinase [Candidatus Eremiobacteraeota bacterium]
MATRSLRFQLLAGLLIPLGIVACIQFSVAYRNAEVTAHAVTDRILLASARSIAEHIGFGDSGLDATIPPAALGMFDLGYGDTVYYRVTRADGRLLAGYLDLPAPPVPAPASQPEYYDGRYHDESIRLVAVTQPVALANGVENATVVVAETLYGRNAMSRELWIGSAWQQSLLIVIACVLAWLALRRVFTPLLRLSREVETRAPDDFRPFSVAALQAELDPLVRALNEYMGRLRAQLDAQRRFTENAAHQLRTPLTLLRTQASFALRGADERERAEATRAIVATTQQITRLANQLLSLAKAEPHGQPPRRDAIDLVATTRDILVEHGRLAVDRQVDLAFEVAAPAPAATVRADPTMLRDLIVNLVDNAVRYTPPGGQVTVTVDRDPDACVLRVEDTGPGIPAAQRALVFERFYRVPGGDSEGSGLGLAIVKEIVDAHGAAIDLREREGGGLVVAVRFPVAEEPLSGAGVAEAGRTPREEPVLGPR